MYLFLVVREICNEYTVGVFVGCEQSSKTSSSIPYPGEDTHNRVVISTGELSLDSINSFPQERVYVGESSSTRTSWPRRGAALYPNNLPASDMQQNGWSVANDQFANQNSMVERINCNIVYKY